MPVAVKLWDVTHPGQRTGAGEIAMWSRAGSVACIPAEAWLPADRATVRLMNPPDAH